MNGSDNITQSNIYCSSLPDSERTRIAKITASLLVGGIAVFGNILIIFLAARFTVKRNIHHLIINMAASDLLVVILFSYHNTLSSLLGFPHLWNLWNNDIFAIISCKAERFLGHAFMFVTLSTLLIISVERFRSTKLTVQRVRPYTLKKRLALVSCSWLISMGLSAYNAWYFNIAKRGDTRVCVMTFSTTMAHLYSSAHLCVLVMMCLVVIFNIMTSFRLWKSGRTFSQGNISEEQNRTREKRTAKAVKMVMCSLLLYTCCYLPAFLVEFFVAFDNAKVFSVFQPYFWCTIEARTLDFGFYFLLLVNSCFSPCIYIVFLAEFRQEAKRLLNKLHSNEYGIELRSL